MHISAGEIPEMISALQILLPYHSVRLLRCLAAFLLIMQYPAFFISIQEDIQAVFSPSYYIVIAFLYLFMVISYAVLDTVD